LSLSALSGLFSTAQASVASAKIWASGESYVLGAQDVPCESVAEPTDASAEAGADASAAQVCGHAAKRISEYTLDYSHCGHTGFEYREVINTKHAEAQYTCDSGTTDEEAMIEDTVSKNSMHFDHRGPANPSSSLCEPTSGCGGGSYAPPCNCPGRH